MAYYLSIDSGGTKTACALADENGMLLAEHVGAGCTYSVSGKEAVLIQLKEEAEETLRIAGIRGDQITGAVWGIPCYGEYKAFDSYLREKLPQLFSGGCYLCNDVEVGMAGSLLLEAGVHIVSGTGAIAMGKNREGDICRANGWHEDFSDEGSGCWLGMQTISLFAKQSDGRKDKGALYRLLCREWNLETDMDIVEYYENHLKGRRERIAAVQKLLLQAAEDGDESAKELYRKAAKELADTAVSICESLRLEGQDRKVSYYGGVFRSGAYILEPLKRELRQHGAVLLEPELSPVSGGILLAAEKAGSTSAKTMIKNLKRQEADKLQI